MCNSIKKLMDGDAQIAKYYQEAKKLWMGIDISDSNLEKILKDKQFDFEHNCGGRELGVKIMVCYGVLQYIHLDTPNIESAKKISNAFINSNCNNEVKFFAKDIAKIYHL